MSVSDHLINISTKDEEAAPSKDFCRIFGNLEHFMDKSLQQKHIITLCLRRLEDALSCLRLLLPEIGNQRKLEHRTTLYILNKSSNWIQWEEGLNLIDALPRIAVLIEASDLIILRKKSSFYHQSLSLFGKILDEFAPYASPI